MAEEKKGTTSSISDLLKGSVKLDADNDAPTPSDDDLSDEENLEDVESLEEDSEELETDEEDEEVAEETVEDSEEDTTSDEDTEPGFVIDQTVKVGDKESRVIYRDVDSLKRGVLEKEKMILKEQSARETEEQKRIEAEARLRNIGNQKPESDKAKFVQENLPKEYRGKVPDDFEDVAELRKFTRAEAKAEAAWDNHLAEAKRLEQDLINAQTKAIQEAQTAVENEVLSKLEHIPNSEGKAAFRDALSTEVQVAEDQTITYRDIARMMAEVDPKVASLFLDGIQKQLNGETSKKVATVVKKNTKKTKPITNADAPSGPQKTGLRGRQSISASLKKTSKK